MLLSEHIEAPVYAQCRAAPATTSGRPAYNRAPTTPGLYNGPCTCMTQYQSGSVRGAGAATRTGPGTKPGFKRIVVKRDREHRGAAGQPAVRRHRLRAGRGRGRCRSTRCWRCRSSSPTGSSYISEPALTYEHIDAQSRQPDAGGPARAQGAAARRSTARRWWTSCSRACSRRHSLGQSEGSDVPRRGCRVYRLRSRQARKRCWPRPAGSPGPDGICRNAEGRAPVAGVRHHRRQPDARADAAGAAEPVESRLHRDPIKNEPPRTLFGETLKQRTYGGLAMYAWRAAISYPPRAALCQRQ